MFRTPSGACWPVERLPFCAALALLVLTVEKKSGQTKLDSFSTVNQRMYRLLSGLHAHLTRKEEFNVILIGLDHAGKTTLLEKVKTIYNPAQPGLNPSQISPTIGQNIGRIALSSTYLKFWDLGGSAEIRPIWEKYYNDADAVCWILDSRDRFRNGWAGEGGYKSGVQGSDVKGKGKARSKERVGAAETGASTVRLGEGWSELENVLGHPLIAHSNIPILVIANKQDGPLKTGGPSRLRSPSRTGFPQGLQAEHGVEEGPKDEQDDMEPMKVEEIKDMFNRLVMESERSEKARSLGLSEAHVVGASALTGQGIQDAINWLFFRVASKGQSRRSQQEHQQLRHSANPSSEPAPVPSHAGSSVARLADLGKSNHPHPAPIISGANSYPAK